MTVVIPAFLVETCRRWPERSAWLDDLPAVIAALRDRWSIDLDAPFDGPEVSASWVAPATRADGTAAVLKVGMPHMEADHEIAGFRFWDGDPTVRIFEADEGVGAMLLERCEPGTVLRELPEGDQDVVIAGLLRRLWRPPTPPHPFRPLSAMMAYWSDETRAAESRWPDLGLVREGLGLFDELSRPADDDVLLATDLHAGNVLRARRATWLVIDPKPFVGDRAYDATQHLRNCPERMHRDPRGTIARFADLLDVDPERVTRWVFARAAAEHRDAWDDWDDDQWALATVLAP
jgi:streptomycin 6-kinase